MTLFRLLLRGERSKLVLDILKAVLDTLKLSIRYFESGFEKILNEGVFEMAENKTLEDKMKEAEEQGRNYFKQGLNCSCLLYTSLSTQI